MRPKEILDASSITQTSEKSTCQSRPGCLNRCLMERYRLRSMKGENFQISSLSGQNHRAVPATTA